MAESLFDPAPGLADQVKSALRAIRRYWVVPVVALVVCLALAVAAYLVMPRTYASTNTAIVVAGGGDTIGNYQASDNLAMAKAETYRNIGSSPEVAAIAAEQLNGVPVKGISFTAAAGTSQIRITGMSDTAEGAAQVANAYADALNQEVERIESLMSSAGQETEGGTNLVQLAPVSTATPPSGPVSPSLTKNLLYGLGAGLLIGALYVIARSLFDRRIRSNEAVERSTGLAVIGTVPSDKRLDDHRQLLDLDASTSDRSQWATAEAFRELRTNLTYANVDDPARSFVVTSSLPGEGKSSVAANLAATLAAAGQPTVLIDADLRRSVQPEIFGLPGGAGLTGLLSGAATPDQVMQESAPGSNLYLLAAGRVPPNPSELLASQTMGKLVADLSEDHMVIIDSPPLLPVTDAAILAGHVDSVMVVAQANRTNVDDLSKAVDRLRKVHAPINGVVLNRVPRTGASASQYGYYAEGYYYSTNKGDSKRKKKAKKASGSSAAGHRSGADATTASR